MNVSQKTFDLSISEKYRDAVPELTPDERHALKESMIVRGQLTPIECNIRGIILDGHNRFEICQELGLEPKYNIRDFDNETVEYQYVLEVNLTRRQLNSFQRIELYFKVFQIEKELAAKRRSNEVREKKGRATAIIGRRIGLGHETVRTGVWLLENASEEDLMNLREGHIAIATCYSKYKKDDRLQRIHMQNKKRDVQCPMCSHQMSRDELIVLK